MRHLPGAPWIDRDEDRNRNSCYAVTNPQRTTARHLAEGIVTSSEEIFAAFAIHALVIYEDISYHAEIGDLAWTVVHRLDSRRGRYRSANSKHVFVHPDGGTLIIG